MQRQHRLKKDAEFKQVRNKGRSWANSSLVLYALVTDQSVTRVGISVSKRIGNAVKRNRVKRLIREAVRLRLPELRSGWDLLFIARKPIAEAKFTDVQGTTEQLFRRASLFVDAQVENVTGNKPMTKQGTEVEAVSGRRRFGTSENCSERGQQD